MVNYHCLDRNDNFGFNRLSFDLGICKIDLEYRIVFSLTNLLQFMIPLLMSRIDLIRNWKECIHSFGFLYCLFQCFINGLEGF